MHTTTAVTATTKARGAFSHLTLTPHGEMHVIARSAAMQIHSLQRGLACEGRTMDGPPKMSMEIHSHTRSQPLRYGLALSLHVLHSVASHHHQSSNGEMTIHTGTTFHDSQRGLHAHTHAEQPNQRSPTHCSMDLSVRSRYPTLLHAITTTAAMASSACDGPGAGAGAATTLCMPQRGGRVRGGGEGGGTRDAGRLRVGNATRAVTCDDTVDFSPQAVHTAGHAEH